MGRLPPSLKQDMKRMVTSSSVGHMGYVLLPATPQADSL